MNFYTPDEIKKFQKQCEQSKKSRKLNEIVDKIETNLSKGITTKLTTQEYAIFEENKGKESLENIGWIVDIQKQEKGWKKQGFWVKYEPEMYILNIKEKEENVISL